jgi:plastocyanin
MWKVAAAVLACPLIWGCMDAGGTFGNPTRSPHHETNTPAHAQTYAGAPVNIAIDFNFDLGPGSVVSAVRDGVEYTTGSTTIDANRLAMGRPFDTGAPDGLYDVSYTACWPDGSCHEGFFQFSIDRALASEYTDMRGRPEVRIALRDLRFVPSKVRISSGTNVVWTNEDNAEHYVNTDSHPAHTYHPAQNSMALAGGGTFSVTFTDAGVYPYHCSAHTSMTASILVE